MRFVSICSGLEAATVALGPIGWQCLAVAEIDPFCCHLLHKRYGVSRPRFMPRVEDAQNDEDAAERRQNIKLVASIPEKGAIPNLGDMMQADPSEFAGKADALVGGTPCFPAGTLILCKRGLVPIEQVTVGDYVLTHVGRYQRVLKTGSKSARTIALKGQGHSGLETTEEHPFYATSHMRAGFKRDEHGKQHPMRVFAEPGWIQARHMQGKFWASPTVFPSLPVPDIPDFEFPPGFWWMVGAFLGNGWTRSGRRPGRPATQECSQILICTNGQKADQMAMRLMQSGLRFARQPQKTCIRFVAQNITVRRWIDEQFGKYADGKRIPAWVLGLPRECREALLEGYAFTDGHVRPNGGVNFSTVSPYLATGVKLLIHSLGLACTVGLVKNKRERCVIDGRIVSEKPYWNTRTSLSSRSSVVIRDHRYGLVRSIASTGEEKEVFNLEVESDNSYTADGIVVHNCQSFSVAGLRKGLHDTRGNLTLRFVEYADAIIPRYLLWENVPGVLSDRTNAFGCFLGGIAGADSPLVPARGQRWTYCGVVNGPKRRIAWRTLDAQWYGLAQRRERVFVVASAGDGAHPIQILLNEKGMWGNTAPRREEREATTGTLEARTRGGGGLGTDFECAGGACRL